MKLNKVQPEFSFSNKELTELIQATLAKDASFRIQVKGFSMSPFIKDGDVVTISPPSISSAGLGKIVAFIHPETKKLIIHRIVKTWGDNYLIKGDGSRETDVPVSKRDILGTVTSVERQGKKVFIGLGMERFIIAFFSRRRHLFLIYRCWRFIPLPVRKFVKCRILL